MRPDAPPLISKLPYSEVLREAWLVAGSTLAGPGAYDSVLLDGQTEPIPAGERVLLRFAAQFRGRLRHQPPFPRTMPAGFGPDSSLTVSGGCLLPYQSDDPAGAFDWVLAHCEDRVLGGTLLALAQFVVNAPTATRQWDALEPVNTADDAYRLALRLRDAYPGLRASLTGGAEVRDLALLDERFVTWLDARGAHAEAVWWRGAAAAWERWFSLDVAPVGSLALLTAARAIWLTEFRGNLGAGQSDFRRYRESPHVYVDKSRFISDVLEDPAQVLLFTRPRRFGKTLNLSMLRHYLTAGDPDASEAFAGLQITHWEQHDKHFQAFPVLYLTLKDASYPTLRECLTHIRELLRVALEPYEQQLRTLNLKSAERRRLTGLLDEDPEIDLSQALRWATAWLEQSTGQPVIVLIDEYDKPIMEAVRHGYADEALAWFQRFLSAGLKDNASLKKGVLTGILRVARESIFSGLNNLTVHSVLSQGYADCFGFSEPEVRALAVAHGFEDQLDPVRRWYDGYRIGQSTVFNPWSVLQHAASGSPHPEPHWVRTSSDELVSKLLLGRANTNIGAVMLRLMESPLTIRFSEDATIRDIATVSDEDALTILLFAGYLTAEAPDEQGRRLARIPNEEVKVAFRRIYAAALQRQLGGTSRVERLLAGMLSGDATAFEGALQHVTRDVTSYHDLPLGKEAHFHNFVLGVLASVDGDYIVRSQLEAGFGRSDVTLRPRHGDGAAVVIEFKACRGEDDLDAAVEAARLQLRDRDYAAEMRDLGHATTHMYAVASAGKRVRVAAVDP